MLFSWLRRNPSYDAARKMAAARRSGRGFRVHDWTMDLAGDSRELVGHILEWCREEMGRTRRPYGIADFDFALSARLEGSKETTPLAFDRLAPAALYDGTLERHLAGHFAAVPSSGRVHVAVALFSWGEAAYEAFGFARA